MLYFARDGRSAGDYAFGPHRASNSIPWWTTGNLATWIYLGSDARTISQATPEFAFSSPVV
jgi:hypothetical protein